MSLVFVVANLVKTEAKQSHQAQRAKSDTKQLEIEAKICNRCEASWGGGGGGAGRAFRPIFVASCLFALFRLRNIAQCCVIFPISSASRHLGNSAFRFLYSRLPYTSCLVFAPLSPSSRVGNRPKARQEKLACL